MDSSRCRRRWAPSLAEAGASALDSREEFSVPRRNTRCLLPVQSLNSWALAMALAALVLLAVPVAAQEDAAATLQFSAADADSVGDADTVRLYNEYIAIIVNATEENTGRFAVQTTGGDPDRESDNESPLIYMIPGQVPWTSYATVRIDGIDYVFGGKATERAGRAGLTGEQLIAPRVVDGRLIETA